MLDFNCSLKKYFKCIVNLKKSFKLFQPKRNTVFIRCEENFYREMIITRFILKYIIYDFAGKEKEFG